MISFISSVILLSKQKPADNMLLFHVGSSVCWCQTYLPIFSCGGDWVAEELVDDILSVFHYQIVLLMFVSNEVVGLAVLLVALSVDFW